MTPAREASAAPGGRGALQLSSSGRVSTPDLSNERIEELAALRALIEVELASRALPRAHMALIDRLQTINGTIADAVRAHDPWAISAPTWEFHRTLYLRAQAPAMLAMTETVWLQLGPTMCKLYGRMRRSEAPHFHLHIIAALKAGDRTEAAPGGALGRDPGSADADDLSLLTIWLSPRVTAPRSP